jgi:hypothetical protein
MANSRETHLGERRNVSLPISWQNRRVDAAPLANAIEV